MDCGVNDSTVTPRVVGVNKCRGLSPEWHGSGLRATDPSAALERTDAGTLFNLQRCLGLSTRRRAGGGLPVRGDGALGGGQVEPARADEIVQPVLDEVLCLTAREPDAVVGLIAQRIDRAEAEAQGLAITGDARALKKLRPLVSTRQRG